MNSVTSFSLEHYAVCTLNHIIKMINGYQLITTGSIHVTVETQAKAVVIAMSQVVQSWIRLMPLSWTYLGSPRILVPRISRGGF